MQSTALRAGRQNPPAGASLEARGSARVRPAQNPGGGTRATPRRGSSAWPAPRAKPAGARGLPAQNPRGGPRAPARPQKEKKRGGKESPPAFFLFAVLALFAKRIKPEAGMGGCGCGDSFSSDGADYRATFGKAVFSKCKFFLSQKAGKTCRITRHIFPAVKQSAQNQRGMFWRGLPRHHSFWDKKTKHKMQVPSPVMRHTTHRNLRFCGRLSEKATRKNKGCMTHYRRRPEKQEKGKKYAPLAQLRTRGATLASQFIFFGYPPQKIKGLSGRGRLLCGGKNDPPPQSARIFYILAFSRRALKKR